METSESKGGDSGIWMLGLVVAAIVAYVSLYFVIVRPGATAWFAPTGVKTFTMPDYRGLSPTIFAPVHYVDRAFLRPRLWGKIRVWSAQKTWCVLTNELAVPLSPSR